ncbi:MAG: phage portal protein [Eubacteriales bacterium]|nr:phage portal protein [Eubacteriales bacterium]
MAFSFKKWFLKKIGADTARVDAADVEMGEYIAALESVYLRELAFWTCVNKIANAISKCEFRTYQGRREVQKAEYYLWNVEPNRNQNAPTFLTKLIGQLYRNNEALVIESGGQLYVADDYQKQVFALYDYQFTGVTVDDFTFSKTFYQNEVLFFQLNSVDMRRLTNLMSEEYGKLYQYAAKAYQTSRGHRGTLHIDAMAQQQDNFSDKLNELLGTHFKKFFSSENAVLPLFDGYTYEELNQKTYNNESTRDIKALADDIYDYTARAFSFPPSLAKGDVQDTSKAIDELLTFCIDPLALIIQTEINRKRYGVAEYAKGNYIRIDTTRVKHIDIFDIAAPIDKLISSGAFTINDIRRLIHEPEIAEEWADQHFITKNYSTIQDLLESLSKEEQGEQVTDPQPEKKQIENTDTGGQEPPGEEGG